MKTKDITFLIPSMNGGGAEKVTLLLANELVDRGWDVSVLMSRAEGPYLNKLHADIKIISLTKRGISENIFEIVKYLRSNKPSIFYSSMMYVNVVAGIASKFSGFKGMLIFSEHSHISTSIRNNKSLTTKIIFALAKWLYKDADAVICVSDGVKQDLISNIKNIKNVKVINNPVEDLSDSIVLAGKSKYRIISIGRLDRDKNFQLLLKAFAMVLKEIKNAENYELFILGEGYERINLEELVCELNLQGKVFLPGFVDSPGQMLKSSDLFVFTSVREGFGNVLVEALSCGLPVISSDCKSGPAEILQYGVVGKLVPINDLVSLKEAILDEINHPNNSSTYEQRIQRAKDFSITKIANIYESVFLDFK